MYKSSASIIIFVEFYDLSYVKVQASWYIAFLRVSLRVSSLGGVGVTQKISALCKGASNVSSCVFSFIYLFFSFLDYYTYMVFGSLSAFAQIWR